MAGLSGLRAFSVGELMARTMDKVTRVTPVREKNRPPLPIESPKDQWLVWLDDVQALGRF
jgi:hypothetical protein